MPYLKIKYHMENPEIWVKLTDEQANRPPWDLDDLLDLTNSEMDFRHEYCEVVPDLPEGATAHADISEES